MCGWLIALCLQSASLIELLAPDPYAGLAAPPDVVLAPDPYADGERPAATYGVLAADPYGSDGDGIAVAHAEASSPIARARLASVLELAPSPYGLELAPSPYALELAPSPYGSRGALSP